MKRRVTQGAKEGFTSARCSTHFGNISKTLDGDLRVGKSGR
jgi:hypothetical protein